MPSKSTHGPVNGSVSLLLMAEYFSIVHMHHSFFIHLSVNGHLGCFHTLAIVNSTAMNTGVHVSFLASFFFLTQVNFNSDGEATHGRPPAPWGGRGRGQWGLVGSPWRHNHAPVRKGSCWVIASHRRLRRGLMARPSSLPFL